MTPRVDSVRPVHAIPPLVWLAVAVTLLTVSNGRWIVPAATWLGPVFMLHLLDSTRRWPGLMLMLASSLLLWPFSWQGMIPAPGWLYFMVTTIYAGIYFLPYLAHRLLASESTGFASTLVFPSAWVGVDLLFQRFVTPYGSWTSLAYTQLDFLSLAQFSSIAGGFGITFLVTWFAATVAWLWKLRVTVERLRLAALAYGIPWAAVIAFGAIRLAAAGPPTAPLRVAAITPSEELAARFSEAFQSAVAAGSFDEATTADLRAAATRLNADLLERTRRAATDGIDLVAWSETAARVTPALAAELLSSGQRLVDSHRIVLALAYATWDPEATPPVANMLTVLSPDTSAPLHYRKAHPIYGAESPFMGEGSPTVAVVETAGVRLGTVICHDLDFPALIREAGRTRVELLLAPSADWPAIESMHANMAKLRAVENGFTLIRPTAGGRTLAVDTRGRETPWTGRDGVLITDIAATGAGTVYARIGDLFAWLCLACFLLLAANAWRARAPERTIPVVQEAS